MKKQRRAPLVVCMMLAAGSAAGQATPEYVGHLAGNELAKYEIKYYGLREGLTERSVSALCHDHEGMVWIGTETTLFRFDGFEMLPIPLPIPPDSSGQKRTVLQIHAICEDPFQRLWVATQYGLFMFPPDRNRPRRIWHEVSQTILPERDYLLFSTTFHLKRLRLPLAEGSEASVEDVGFSKNLNWVSIFPGNDGTYFLVGDTAAVWQVRNDTILRRYPGIRPGVTAVRARLPGRVVVAHTVHQSFAFRLDERRGVFEETHYSKPTLPDNPYYFSHLARQFVEANPLQIPREIARWIISGSACWQTDAHGRVWLGTAYGIFVFSRREARFEHLPFVRGMSCRAIFKEGKDIWVSGGGLFQGQETSQKAKVFPVDVSRAMLPLDGERLLSAGEFDGFEVFNRKTGQLLNIERQQQGHCHNLLRLRNGDIWAHRRATLYQFFPDKNQAQPVAEVSFGGYALTLVEDRRGQVWVPNNFSLLKIERGPDGQYLRHRRVSDGTFTDALLCGDTLWLGTRGAGLLCFDTKTERQLATFTTGDGLPNDFINCLLPDGAGNIWLSTNAGLSCFDPKTGVFSNFSSRDGLEMDEYNMSSAFRDPATGQLYFGGLNGVTLFDPAAVRKSLTPPEVLFSKIVRMSEQAGTLTTFLPDNDALPLLELASGDRYLEFHLASDDPAAAEHTQFVYRLDGFDRDWMSAGKSNIARFALLPAGDYVFRAKTVARDGIVSPERTIRIHVEQVFYKKWWFVLLVLATVAGAIFGEYRRRIHILKNIFQVRKRIADDLHDDVASSLNYLSMLVKSLREKSKTAADKLEAGGSSEGREIVGRLAQIESLNDEVIGKLSDIVWAIDQRSQTLGDLIERMQDYGEDLLLQNNVPVEFQIQVEHMTKTPALAVRQHVLLIFKEAVSNIVRHTKSYEVKIRIENQSDWLKIELENIFAETRRPQFSTGKGLESMAKRAENLFGSLHIEQGEGLFRVNLFLPKIFD
ncbi:MAG: two-component regulator propeller domain-containing protein [Saprospiraceae bacterium]